MRPVSVEIITYAPTTYYHCQHCEVTFEQAGLGERLRKEQAATALPPDLQQEFDALLEWLHGVLTRHGERLRIKLIDAASMEGVWKSLRYGVRKYPALVVEGREKHIGTDFEAVEPVIERYVGAGA